MRVFGTEEGSICAYKEIRADAVLWERVWTLGKYSEVELDRTAVPGILTQAAEPRLRRDPDGNLTRRDWRVKCFVSL